MTEGIVIISLLFAGFIRGYTGFGFSGFMILVLSFLYPVQHVVPAVVLIDLLLSVPLVYRSYQHIEFHTLRPLLVATVVGIPFGYLLLLLLSDTSLKILVPAAILSLALLSRYHATQALFARSAWLCGFMSGWTTSAVSAGGVPAVIYLRSHSTDLEQQRHNLNGYFVFLMGFVVLSGVLLTGQLHGLPDYPLGYAVLAIAASWLGQKAFAYKPIPKISQLSFYLLLLLCAIALVIACRAAFTV